MASTVYLSVEQVIDLHAEALRFGGADGLRSRHLLHSAVAQAEQSAFGKEAYSTVPEKAAAYAFFLVMNHPFVDGNKRTGELAMLVFLELNGFDFGEDQDQIAEMFERLAAGEVRQEEFFAWVRVNATFRAARR